MGKEKREANESPIKTSDLSPQRYDTLTGQGMISVKNLDIEKTLNSKRLIPIEEVTSKTTYKVKLGKFPI